MNEQPQDPRNLFSDEEIARLLDGDDQTKFAELMGKITWAQEVQLSLTALLMRQETLERVLIEKDIATKEEMREIYIKANEEAQQRAEEIRKQQEANAQQSNEGTGNTVTPDVTTESD